MSVSRPILDVAIVGAGFAGLYLLHRFRKLGLSAQIWEAGSGVGGTWYWNRYPGARCDIESVQYSFQFDEDLQQDWDWTERYASQQEILRYAEHVTERFGLRDGIEFNKRVASAEFDPDEDCWLLTAEDQDTMKARFCVMATGCLSKPNWPDLAGYKDFAGQIYHTATWPHEGVDLAGKHVAVIGTGSSGIQSIPRIAEQAAHLTVFQRTPNYSIPAHNHPMDPDYAAKIKASYPELRARASKTLGLIDGDYNTASALSVSDDERLAEFERRWAIGGLTFSGSYGDFMLNKAANDTLVSFVHGKIRRIVDDPETAELLCPDNIIGAKRLCVDTGYYATFNRENVDLVDIRKSPIERIVSEGVKIGQQVYRADIIVIATGFDAMTGALNQIEISGRSGVALRERWKDGPSSYLGLAMHDYPNLFTVTGPGSPSVLSNMLPSIEQHVEWITDCIAYLRANGHVRIEATQDAETDWWQHVQDVGQVGLKQSTDSWYLGANIKGKPRVFMPYLGGCPAYRQKCDEVAADSYQGFEIT